MIEPLSLERFRRLADAYGGVVARWPDADRAAAMQMASRPAAAEILAQASLLDDSLDAWRISAPSAELRRHVLAAAPAPRRSMAGLARLWWSGFGIAAALSGAAAGAATVAIVAPIELSPDASTSFGDVAAQGS